MEFHVDLVEPVGVPLFERVADEAYALYRLGWNIAKIAKHFRIDGKTAKKAVEWARGFEEGGG